MTVDPYWTVWCDSCHTWQENATGETNAQARRNARACGWLVERAVQLCPSCRAAGRRP